MLYLVLTGAPGSGKGTQSELLASHYGLRHLSTGDLFRSHMAQSSALGLEVRRYLDNGVLVPDSLVLRMVEAVLDADNEAVKGFLFDGFPRTLPQAKALSALIQRLSGPRAKVLALHLEVPEAHLWSRIKARGKESGRADDQNDEKIRTRIEVYARQTRPILDYYEAHYRLGHIKGVGTIKEVFKALCSQLDRLLLESQKQ